MDGAVSGWISEERGECVESVRAASVSQYTKRINLRRPSLSGSLKDYLRRALVDYILFYIRIYIYTYVMYTAFRHARRI